ncbi:MAG: hypothetical protein QN149_13570 [Armatimonadota bacterium]|nr:hypothetical protein [Armatimonadota bacterium]MDR7529105.1 hypothetical protein [Armatimonadota bacterium]MDR7548292.1 hypothetical protein [Armatimonadota bacterium]
MMTVRRGHRLAALISVCAAGIALAVLRPPASAAAASAVSSVEFTTFAVLQSGAPASWFVRGAIHMERQVALGSASLHLTLDPGVVLDLTGAGATQWSSGVTEAYIQRPVGPVDLRVGVERLPLETARLMVPFSVEPGDALGTRLGRAGVRAAWTPDAATRVRAALLEHSGAVLPALSLRRQFSSWELEAHALLLPGDRTAVGAGGSGLLGSLVLYGEAWALTAPADTRYAVGISGSIRNGLWTLETGRAAATVPGDVVLDDSIRRQAVGQIVYRLSEELTVTGTVRAFLDDGPERGQAIVQVSQAIGDTQYAISLIFLVGTGPPRGIITAGASVSF